MTKLEVKRRDPLEDRMRVSDEELASFLRQLALMYKSPATGNLALSESLRELAMWVGRRSNEIQRTGRSRTGKKLERISFANLNELKTLDSVGIEKFIADESRTKLELVDLAHVRFSIPRSQLLRMKISDVRNTVRSAMLHENSIEIIAEEARRDGGNRNS